MLELIASACGNLPITIGETYTLTLITIATAAFLGGFAHCAFMCGPLVIMQTSKILENTPANKTTELTRLKGAALAPYHLGRITTYSFLGAIAGALGQAVNSFWQHAFAIAILIAGTSLILSVIPFVKIPSISNYIGKVISSSKTPALRNLFNTPTNLRGYLLGVILGFLPCGMVYAGLAAATSAGTPFKGLILMAVFGLATVPALLTVGLLGNILIPTLRKRLFFFIKTATVLAGAWLCVLSINILLN